MSVLPIRFRDDATRLQRAMATLQLAGICGELASGVSDEGEPWAVICRPDGAVAVHLAIIGGHLIFVDEATMLPERTV